MQFFHAEIKAIPRKELNIKNNLCLIEKSQSSINLLNELIIKLFQRSAQLVGTTGHLASTADAIKGLLDIVNVHTARQSTYSFKIAVAPSEETYILKDAVFIHIHLDKSATSARGFIRNMLIRHPLPVAY